MFNFITENQKVMLQIMYNDPNKDNDGFTRTDLLTYGGRYNELRGLDAIGLVEIRGAFARLTDYGKQVVTCSIGPDKLL